MPSTVRSVAVGIPAACRHSRAADRHRPNTRPSALRRALHLAVALAAPVALLLLPAPQAGSRQPGDAPAPEGKAGPSAREKLAQAPSGPSLEVVQVLIVDPGKEVPLSLQVKAKGALPNSFI